MKRKYSLNIADMEISVVSDASPEEIERIRGILDRKMREIYLVSRCPKTEASMLCAMSFCADRLSFQERNAELEETNRKYASVTERFQDHIKELDAELEKVRNENAILRSLLTQGAQPAPNPIPPADFLAGEKHASAPKESGQTPETEKKDEARKPSRVGSMFDLLSFGEVE